MKWFHSKANLIKLIIAALLVLFLVLGFVEYYIADKAIAPYSKSGSIETFKFVGKNVAKDKISWTFNETTKILKGTKITTNTITSFGPTLKTGLMKATLAFSIISLITVFIVLGAGNHKKPAVSLVVTILGTVILLTLFILVVILMSNLSSVNSGLKTQEKVAEYNWVQDVKNVKDHTKGVWEFVKFH